jgi:hypothetical protein
MDGQVSEPGGPDDVTIARMKKMVYKGIECFGHSKKENQMLT